MTVGAVEGRDDPLFEVSGIRSYEILERIELGADEANERDGIFRQPPLSLPAGDVMVVDLSTWRGESLDHLSTLKKDEMVFCVWSETLGGHRLLPVGGVPSPARIAASAIEIEGVTLLGDALARRDVTAATEIMLVDPAASSGVRAMLCLALGHQIPVVRYRSSNVVDEDPLEGWARVLPKVLVASASEERYQ